MVAARDRPLTLLDEFVDSLTGANRAVVPFLACGDLSSYDSDMTYPLKVIFMGNLYTRRHCYS